MRSKKEIEFLKLKQGNMTFDEYVAKFEEHVKFCPLYNSAVVEGSKCIKFERGLHPKIKHGFGYQETCRFSILVNKCMIYDEESRAQYAYQKRLGEKIVNDQSRGTPYGNPFDKGN